ncbi:olfactory receptor 10C1-like [Ranitomeya variabilis]|uniref:olfactory receptor 10C1-like n=1 Tax=Ranitomeya variabilis TaxID=490064 RepID=UPI00405721D9
MSQDFILLQMEEFSNTSVKEFILLSFSNFNEFQVLFFITILIMYLVCIFGNLLTVILVEISSSLHLPMYFFISVFSVSEMLFVSITVPKLLVNLIVAEKYISFTGCFLQLFIYSSLGATECCLLAVMAFDRDLAINIPLRYGSIMTHNLCVKLVIIPWFFGFGMGSIPTLFMVNLNYCGPNVINHFFCDLAPLQSLSCSNPFRSQLTTTISAAFGCVVPFIFIMAFYFHIVYAISKIRSVEGKAKAFSTCSSHLIVTSLFYGTIIIVYIRPQTSQYDKYLALIYTVVVPFLNPFIYTLRNKEIKIALCDPLLMEDSIFLGVPTIQLRMSSASYNYVGLPANPSIRILILLI